MRLELNLPKIDLELQRCVLVSSCPKEDNSFPRLAEATLVDIRDEEQGFNVQGVPLGGSLYVKKVLEETAGKVARFCEHVVHLIHPQTGFNLVVERAAWCTCFARSTVPWSRRSTNR